MSDGHCISEAALRMKNKHLWHKYLCFYKTYWCNYLYIHTHIYIYIYIYIYNFLFMWFLLKLEPDLVFSLLLVILLSLIWGRYMHWWCWQKKKKKPPLSAMILSRSYSISYDQFMIFFVLYFVITEDIFSLFLLSPLCHVVINCIVVGIFRYLKILLFVYLFLSFMWSLYFW